MQVAVVVVLPNMVILVTAFGPEDFPDNPSAQKLLPAKLAFFFESTASPKPSKFETGRAPASTTNMADRPASDTKPKCTPAELMLKVILTGTLSHYETRGMIDDKRLEHMLSAGKQILYKTHQESDVR